jgi:hypothetical protein
MNADPLLLLDMTLTTGGRDAAQEIAGVMISEGAEGLQQGPLEVHVHVLRQRPKSHYGTGNSEGLLKESADAYPNMRLGVNRGLTVISGCEGIAWEYGAISALLVTCEWASMNAIHIRIRSAPVATIGDLIRWDMEEPPVPGWTSAA